MSDRSVSRAGEANEDVLRWLVVMSGSKGQLMWVANQAGCDARVLMLVNIAMDDACLIVHPGVAMPVSWTDKRPGRRGMR